MKTELTSKERVLRTIEWKDTDHLPLTINGICHTCVVDINNMLNWDMFKVADYCLELGTDAGLPIDIPFALPPDVEVNYAIWQVPGEKDDILAKEYITPKGKLVQAVRKNKNYPFEEINIFSDHLVPPGRSFKYMVDRAEELEALEAVFSYPGDRAFDETREYAEEARKFAKEREILLTGHLSGIGDPLLWLSGAENIIFMAMDEPDTMRRYIEIISDWDIRCMRMLIDMGVELIIRRGWYESTDFWSPATYREFMLPALKKEVEIARGAGVKYAYIMNSGVDALSELILESGADMQTNAEPEKTDIIGLRNVFKNKVAMCTGINNYHVIEEGDEKAIGEAVRFAVENYAPGGGFILCPSDSVGGFGLSGGGVSEKIIRNVHSLVDSWKEYC